MNNLSHHTDLFELVTSLLIRGIQTDVYKLGWLIGLVKDTIQTIPCIPLLG
jgi:hypothetical protein